MLSNWEASILLHRTNGQSRKSRHLLGRVLKKLHGSVENWSFRCAFAFYQRSVWIMQRFGSSRCRAVTQPQAPRTSNSYEFLISQPARREVGLPVFAIAVNLPCGPGSDAAIGCWCTLWWVDRTFVNQQFDVLHDWVFVDCYCIFVEFWLWFQTMLTKVICCSYGLLLQFGSLQWANVIHCELFSYAAMIRIIFCVIFKIISCLSACLPQQ